MRLDYISDARWRVFAMPFAKRAHYIDVIIISHDIYMKREYAHVRARVPACAHMLN